MQPPAISVDRDQEAIMQNRMPSRRRQPPEAERTRQGNTVPAQGETQQRTPRMPHERDESADSQAAGEPSGQRMGRAGQEALEQGQVDTDKGPALDATYDKVREGTKDPVKKFRP
jgi:hypothetical protein